MGQTIEKICRSCKHLRFTKMSIEEELRCSDCQKPGTSITIVDGVPKAVFFKWDSDTCKAFKPSKNYRATRGDITDDRAPEM